MSQLIKMAKEHKLAAKQGTEKCKPVRVLGPYCDAPSKYRLVIAEGGKKRSVCFKTMEEAEDLKNKLIRHEEQAKAKTIGELVDLWLDFMDRVRGQKMCIRDRRQLIKGEEIPARPLVALILLLSQHPEVIPSLSSLWKQLDSPVQSDQRTDEAISCPSDG